MEWETSLLQTKQEGITTHSRKNTEELERASKPLF